MVKNSSNTFRLLLILQSSEWESGMMPLSTPLNPLQLELEELLEPYDVLHRHVFLSNHSTQCPSVFVASAVWVNPGTPLDWPPQTDCPSSMLVDFCFLQIIFSNKLMMAPPYKALLHVD